MAKSDGKKLKITLVKSGIARPGKHKVVLIGLGLKKLNKSVIRQDTPEIRGMINKVGHLLRVEEM
jgi:large subunit ribosomal protein L30